MKVDFSAIINGLDGTPLDGEQFTLGRACIQALMAPSPQSPRGEPPQSGEEMVALYTLAQSIHIAKGPLELSPEDVTRIRHRVAVQYQAPAVVGPVWAMLNG